MSAVYARFAPRRFRLIVFDWDGTLADSTAIIATSLQRACADLDLPVPDDVAARHVIGLGLTDALQRVAPTLPAVRYPELAMRYRDHFLARDADIPLFDGANDLLRALRGAGYMLAIATGKTRRGLDRALAQHGLADIFEHTRCADEGKSKPDPDMLLCLMGRLEASPRETLMIGDTTHDIEMAQSAGAAAMAVAYGAHPVEQLMRCSVPIAHSIREIGDWLTPNG